MISDLIGIPFKDGGRNRKEGLDCWGLACEVFREYGLELPDYRIDAHDWAAIFEQYQNVKSNYVEVSGNLPVPCLAFMRFNSARGNHVGVYIGGGRFIHARAKSHSCTERLDSPAWRLNIIGYYVPREGWKGEQ
jgi:cell wall-associated NlpC family hydrolase